MDAPADKLFFTPADVASIDYEKEVADPGSYPFTRGRRAGQRGRSTWILRELSGEGSPASSNRQFHELIAKGASGLDVIGDAPTTAWIDPDHPFARAAVGTQGVSICRMDDFFELYDGIDIASLTLSHSLPAWFTVAGLHLLARARGTSAAGLRGSVIQAPLFAEDYCYAVHMPVELRLRLCVD